jgi:hypothetical protein
VIACAGCGGGETKPPRRTLSDRAAIRAVVGDLFAAKGVPATALRFGPIKRQDRNNASLCVTDTSGTLRRLGPGRSAIVFVARVDDRWRVPGQGFAYTRSCQSG